MGKNSSEEVLEDGSRLWQTGERKEPPVGANRANLARRPPGEIVTVLERNPFAY